MDAGAGCLRAGGVDGRAAFLDVLYPAFLIDHERRAIGEPAVRDEHAIVRGYLPLGEIAQ